MTELEGENQKHTEDIHAIITTIVSRRRWQLIDVAELARRLEERRSTNGTITLTRLIVRIYSEVLYDACIGTYGLEQQHLGYQELSRYLHDVSWRFARELTAEEREAVIHQSIAEIYFRLIEPDNRIRSPGAFLMIAVQKLRNTLRKWRNDVLDPWDENADWIETHYEEPPEEQITNDEFRQRIRLCFAQSLQQHNRARRQLWAVWMKYIEGMDYPAISAALHMTTAYARVLTFRGLEQLRNDSNWLELGYEIGLLNQPVQSYPILQHSMMKGVYSDEPA